MASDVVRREAVPTRGGTCRRLCGYMLFALFGFSSWALQNALWLQLPIFTREQPERARFATWMTVVMQVANLAPLVYVAYGRHIALHRSIVVIMVGALLTGVALTRWWALVAGGHSVGLLVGTFIVGGFSSLASVVFWPYVSAFSPRCIVFLSVGESSSGLLLGMLTLSQHPAREDPSFSPTLYFGIVTILMLLSLLAFLVIHYTDFVRAIRSHPRPAAAAATAPGDGGVPSADEPRSVQLSEGLLLDRGRADVTLGIGVSTLQLARRWFRPLACQFLFAWCTFGLLPTAVPFAATSYAHPFTILTWAVVLMQGCDPIARAFALTLTPNLGGEMTLAASDGEGRHRVAPRVRLWRRIGLLRALGHRWLPALYAVLVAYVIGVALSSRSPPAHGSPAGPALLLSAVGLYAAAAAFSYTVVFLYIKAAVAAGRVDDADACRIIAAAALADATDESVRCRDGDADEPTPDDDDDISLDRSKPGVTERVYQLAGLATQLGALTGALLCFVLVETTSLFVDASSHNCGQGGGTNSTRSLASCT